MNHIYSKLAFIFLLHLRLNWNISRVVICICLKRLPANTTQRRRLPGCSALDTSYIIDWQNKSISRRPDSELTAIYFMSPLVYILASSMASSKHFQRQRWILAIKLFCILNFWHSSHEVIVVATSLQSGYIKCTRHPHIWLTKLRLSFYFLI